MATLTANKGIVGNIDFKGINGTFDSSVITGAVLSTGGIGGTFNFIGNVTQNIGTDAAALLI